MKYVCKITRKLLGLGFITCQIINFDLYTFLCEDFEFFFLRNRIEEKKGNIEITTIRYRTVFGLICYNRMGILRREKPVFSDYIFIHKIV